MDQNAHLDLDDELLAEFINESREHLTTIEADLLAIEARGAEIDSDLVNKVFRAAHSIKGASSFFGLNTVKELAHGAETVLDMIRSRKMPPNAEVTNLLLAAFDQLREMINHPGDSIHANISGIVDSLAGLATSYLPQEKKSSLSQTVKLSLEDCSNGVMVSRFAYEQARERSEFLYLAEYDLIHDVERRGRNVSDLFHTLLEAGEILECEVLFDAVGTLNDPIVNRLPLRLVLASSSGPKDLERLLPQDFWKLSMLVDSAPVLSSSDGKAVEEPQQSEDLANLPLAGRELQKPAPASARTEHPAAVVSHPASAAVEDSIRVNVATLETLMNLTGELVLGRNQLRASIAQGDARSLNAANQRISQVASELQDVVMQTRLQPIGNVFGKLPRLVRDLSTSLRKEIHLDIQGNDVALDKTLIESLSDPLTHMVRNAVDHGIESPTDRAAAGKTREGRLTIGARHEAGQVVVEIADDGRGIDPERLAKAALAKGLLTVEKLDSMSSKDKMSLIFLPGFSTNTEVSDVSGRGVGMDVVKTNLDHLGGKVEIISVVGRGTTFRIRLPLTLAIIPCLIVSVGDEQFAIPQINVEEIRHVVPGDSKACVETLGNAEVLVLQDRIIPLVRLDQLLDSKTPANRSSSCSGDRSGLTDANNRTEDAIEIVLVTTGTFAYGLSVGRFHQTEEIVVKPLGAHLKDLEEYAGATILGNGSIALIVDIAGLAAKASISAVTESSSRANLRRAASEQAMSEEMHSLVLFRNGPDVSCAVHSDAVRRIERVKPDQIEIIGGRRTMQYQGGLLPVVTLADTAKIDPIPEGCDLTIIIATVRGHEIGLLGSMPVDVVETGTQIDHSTHRQPGVCGSAIIRGSTALIVDLHELVDASWPEWASQENNYRRDAASGAASTVLLAEDSNFFRAQISRFLTEDGYEVLEASDGEVAWDLLLGNSENVKAVVTDIEMPRLDGLGLVRRIRADQRTNHLPVVALTSLASDEDVARGRDAGVSEYQTKLDREQLLECLRRYTARGERLDTFERQDHTSALQKG